MDSFACDIQCLLLSPFRGSSYLQPFRLLQMRPLSLCTHVFTSFPCALIYHIFLGCSVGIFDVELNLDSIPVLYHSSLEFILLVFLFVHSLFPWESAILPNEKQYFQLMLSLSVLTLAVCM